MASSKIANQIYKYWNPKDLLERLSEYKLRARWDEILIVLLETDPRIWDEGLMIFDSEDLKLLILRTTSLLRRENLALAMAKILMDKVDQDHSLLKGLEDWALNLIDNIYVVCLILFRINKIKGIA